MMSSTNIRVCTTKVKTGCITCRRRRIKCDEDKPACQRCSKSKRLCEGYIRPNTGLRVIHHASFHADRMSPVMSARKTDVNRASKSFHQQGLGYSSHYNPLTMFSIGGFRTDCFNALPIKSTYNVQLAFDNLSRMQFANMNPECRDIYIGWMLSDEMFFEAMITFSKMSMRSSYKPQDRLTHDIRIHISNILPRLTSRLSTLQIQSTHTVVLTTYYLLVLYLSAGDLEAFYIHLAGLKRIPVNRPKLGSPWLDGFINVRIRSAELVARYLAGNADVLAAATDQTRVLHLQPHLPFSQKSTEPGIPRPFRAIAESDKLSSCGIFFLTNIDHYLGRPFVSSSKDWMATLLALRMVESLSPSPFPAHALMPVIER